MDKIILFYKEILNRFAHFSLSVRSGWLEMLLGFIIFIDGYYVLFFFMLVFIVWVEYRKLFLCFMGVFLIGFL